MVALKFVALFFCGLCTDWLWTWWILSCADSRPYRAGLFGALTALNGAVFIVAIFSWPEARSAMGIFTYCFGCGLASFLTVRRAHRG
jgi:hypothetical protein